MVIKLYYQIKIIIHTIKILIEARAFIRIMVDAEVGSGRLLEATVLE